MLTNKSALVATIGFSVPDELILKALQDNDLPEGEAYLKANQLSLDSAALDVLLKVRHFTSVKEGSYAVTMDAKVLAGMINTLATKTGRTEDLINEQPTIRARHIW